jgi:hypothetical protein
VSASSRSGLQKQKCKLKEECSESHPLDKQKGYSVLQALMNEASNTVSM